MAARRVLDLGYLAWTWCIQSQGQVPITEQARHLRELRDGYGGTEPEYLLDAMMRSQTRIVDLETANLSNPRLPAAASTQRQPSRGPPPTVRSCASTRHCCCPRCADPDELTVSPT